MGLMKYTRETKELSINGKNIYGQLYLPLNVDLDNKAPIIIAAHGFNSNTDGINNELSYICNYGIAAFSFDFCGGGNATKSSGKSRDMSVASEMQDLKDVFEEVSSWPFVDTNSIYLFGSSQGGFVSALTAPDLNPHVKALFLEFPAFCIPDDWKERIKTETRECFDFWGVELGQAFLRGLPDYDVFMKAAEYAGPTYIFHGDADPVVNISYAHRLETAYKNAELTCYKGEGHGFRKEALQDMAGKIAAIILK